MRDIQGPDDDDCADDEEEKMNEEIDNLLATAQDFDERDEAKRVRYSQMVTVPTRKASRTIFPGAKRKGLPIVFSGEEEEFKN